jgi:phage repressor protein C with HTH and peptisase S24 domain
MTLPLKRPVSPSTISIGQRLSHEMRKRGITSTVLARQAEVRASFIYDIISGKSANPSTIKLARVAKSLGVSLAWLAGNSELVTDSPIIPLRTPHDEYVAISRIAVDISPGGGNVISQAHGGEPCYFSKTWIRQQLLASPDDLRVLYVRGDCMEPTLCHNDQIIIDTSRTAPSPPGIFVLFDGFGLVAKRLEHITHQNQSRLRIISDNPQYSVYERRIEEASIIGRVVWFARQI